jgi:hypothetical protein
MSEITLSGVGRCSERDARAGERAAGCLAMARRSAPSMKNRLNHFLCRVTRPDSRTVLCRLPTSCTCCLSHAHVLILKINEVRGMNGPIIGTRQKKSIQVDFSLRGQNGAPSPGTPLRVPLRARPLSLQRPTPLRVISLIKTSPQ